MKHVGRCRKHKIHRGVVFRRGIVSHGREDNGSDSRCRKYKFRGEWFFTGQETFVTPLVLAAMPQENRAIYIPHLYSASPEKVTLSEFSKDA